MWLRGLTVILLAAVLAVCPLFCVSHACCTLEGLLSCRGEHSHSATDVESCCSGDEQHRQEHHEESHPDCVCSGAVLAKHASPPKMDVSSLWIAKSTGLGLPLTLELSVQLRPFSSPHFAACDTGRAILQATSTLLI